MTASTTKTFKTPSSNAVAAARKDDHKILTQIDGVGDELVTKLLDRFGSPYGVQQAAAKEWETLTEIEGISEAAAVEFHDRMLEAGVPEQEPSADTVRRGHRAKVYHRAGQDHRGEFEVVDVGQEVAGIAVPSLFLKVSPVGDGYDHPTNHKSACTGPTLTTRVPRGTQPYRAFLEHFELPTDAWECPPQEVAEQYHDRIVGRTLPFEFEDGFVVELSSGRYHI
jgi:hypothetical protein